MSREIKFRVWDNWQKKYVFTGFHVIGEVTVFGGIDMVISETREARFAALGYETSIEAWNDFELEEWTGLKDANGKDIYEGDTILASEARYERTLLSAEHGEIPVYEVNHDKPIPAPDVVWFKAVVEWNETMCGYWLRYLDKRADWGPASSVALTDKMYRYEVIGNIHENPELLSHE